jgi:hypothetical protein
MTSGARASINLSSACAWAATAKPSSTNLGGVALIEALLHDTDDHVVANQLPGIHDRLAARPMACRPARPHAAWRPWKSRAHRAAART